MSTSACSAWPAGILGAGRQLHDAGEMHLVVTLASPCSWSSWGRQRRPVRIAGRVLASW